MVQDPRIRAGIFAGESGGDYNALFGFSNRPGRHFSNIRLTDMTVDEAINFSNPRGPYAQWVKSQIGRVATPMGGYQIVGTTLRAAKKALGLTGNERMDEATQNRLGQWILENQGTGAWEGYRGPRTPGISLTSSPSSATTSPSGVTPAYSTPPSQAEKEVYVSAGTENPTETQPEAPKTFTEKLKAAITDEDGALSELAEGFANRAAADAQSYAEFANIQPSSSLMSDDSARFAQAQALMQSLLQKRRGTVPGLSLTGMG